jgi:hypothetical protein
VWLRDEEAALVVTKREAIAKDAGARGRRGKARGARRALENIAKTGDALSD